MENLHVEEQLAFLLRPVIYVHSHVRNGNMWKNSEYIHLLVNEVNNDQTTVISEENHS